MRAAGFILDLILRRNRVASPGPSLVAEFTDLCVREFALLLKTHNRNAG
jgi:hypothetical protein